MLPAPRPSPDPLREELTTLLRKSHRDAMFEDRHWDVADVMEVIWPVVRNAVDEASLGREEVV